jgi:hypothetical protein
MFLLFLLVPCALVLVVLSVLGLAGFGPLTDDRRADRGGALGVVGPAVGLLVGGGVLALTVIGSFLLVGVGGGDDDTESRPPTPRASTPTPKTQRVAEPRPERRVATLGANVIIEADESEGFPDSYDVADRLAANTVLQVHARGFEPFAAAIAEQCAPTVTARCFNVIPVQFDADGEARFQYLVSADFANGEAVPGRCRAGAAPCTIVVRATPGSTHGEIQTIFGDAIAPPGSITVTPAAGLSLAGETVTVEVRDYPPRAKVWALLCAAPDAAGLRCGAPGPQAPVVVGSDGRGSTKLVIEPGPVGKYRVTCGRGDACGISVASPEVFARAPVVPITFAAPPGADYDPTRLALGLAVAALLVGIAAWLVIRTDWSAVGEAAAPEIDDAEYADLDAIIAALPPEADDELVPTH